MTTESRREKLLGAHLERIGEYVAARLAQGHDSSAERAETRENAREILERALRGVGLKEDR